MYSMNSYDYFIYEFICFMNSYELVNWQQTASDSVSLPTRTGHPMYANNAQSQAM